MDLGTTNLIPFSLLIINSFLVPPFFFVLSFPLILAILQQLLFKSNIEFFGITWFCSFFILSFQLISSMVCLALCEAQLKLFLVFILHQNFLTIMTLLFKKCLTFALLSFAPVCCFLLSPDFALLIRGSWFFRVDVIFSCTTNVCFPPKN